MRLSEIIRMGGAPTWLRISALTLSGAVLGGGMLVTHVSRATSYLSDDPATCVNCHVMRPYYASWQHSSHARVAKCVDCHVPHESVGAKYAYKAKDGLRHSTVFTLRREPQVLRATAEAREVIQANCLRCHGNLMAEVPGLHGHNPDRTCIECHRETPHGRAESLSSSPNALVPTLPSAAPDWFRDPEKD